MEEALKQRLATKIAGEITLSDQPCKTIKKWREIFKISQKELADGLVVSPSVISDYESGRRKSPGIVMIKKMVEKIIFLDEVKGGKTIFEFSNMLSGEAVFEVILDIKEFLKPNKASEVVEAVKGEVISGKEYMDRDMFGYTVVDSLRAIIEFNPLELARIYGNTTQRALIFTKVGSGRSPMIAIKLTSLKPAMVVMHGPVEMDKLAIKIAETERLPLVVSKCENIDELISGLRAKFK